MTLVKELLKNLKSIFLIIIQRKIFIVMKLNLPKDFIGTATAAHQVEGIVQIQISGY